jgi:hypothetical protein
MSNFGKKSKRNTNPKKNTQAAMRIRPNMLFKSPPFSSETVGEDIHRSSTGNSPTKNQSTK